MQGRNPQKGRLYFEGFDYAEPLQQQAEWDEIKTLPKAQFENILGENFAEALNPETKAFVASCLEEMARENTVSLTTDRVNELLAVALKDVRSSAQRNQVLSEITSLGIELPKQQLVSKVGAKEEPENSEASFVLLQMRQQLNMIAKEKFTKAMEDLNNPGNPVPIGNFKEKMLTFFASCLKEIAHGEGLTKARTTEKFRSEVRCPANDAPLLRDLILAALGFEVQAQAKAR